MRGRSLRSSRPVSIPFRANTAFPLPAPILHPLPKCPPPPDLPAIDSGCSWTCSRRSGQSTHGARCASTSGPSALRQHAPTCSPGACSQHVNMLAAGMLATMLTACWSMLGARICPAHPREGRRRHGIGAPCRSRAHRSITVAARIGGFARRGKFAIQYALPSSVRLHTKAHRRVTLRKRAEYRPPSEGNPAS